MLPAMKRTPITSFHREAYGLVLEESERAVRPLRSGPPKDETRPGAGLPGDGAKLKVLDLALVAGLVAGGVGFWILVGKLLVRTWALLLSLLS